MYPIHSMLTIGMTENCYSLSVRMPLRGCCPEWNNNTGSWLARKKRKKKNLGTVPIS